ncbi:MAG: acetyl-CoA carboxylase biotin carboxyl carrier protein [Planctomycetaceae bacterium]|nr:acetyl-CoA carboxylase biotin carboxyl carrier protein [Planctomycetaceae bacterium]
MTQKSKSTSGQSSSNSFDLKQLRELLEMMEEHGVTEVNLRQGDQCWRSRRGPAEVAAPAIAPQAYPVAVAAPQPVAAPAPAPAAASPTADANQDDGLLEILSPTVGTFYGSPSPEDPLFVKVGSKVDGESVVCLIEAMKVFNEIQAECAGTIEKILVKDGEAVDFGQPLFKVRPA